MFPILTRAELDMNKCINPDCKDEHHDILVFTGRCHPGAPVRAEYSKVFGTIQMLCWKCKREVVVVRVAP